jgi:hypothetical protein
MAASRSCTGLRGSGDRSGLYAFVPTGESGGGPDIRGRGPEQHDGRDPSVGTVVCPLSASVNINAAGINLEYKDTNWILYDFDWNNDE